jgi:hypothetical protein
LARISGISDPDRTFITACAKLGNADKPTNQHSSINVCFAAIAKIWFIMFDAVSKEINGGLFGI